MKEFKVLISALFVLILMACGDKRTDERIVSVTIEPQRYFAEKIAGDKFKINCVVPAGQSPETYDPTPQQWCRWVKPRLFKDRIDRVRTGLDG